MSAFRFGGSLSGKPMKEDTELLKCYVAHGSEEAFAALVRRRAGFVFFHALRRVGHVRPLAEDVTQTVFSDLACKAAAVAHRPRARNHGAAHPDFRCWVAVNRRNAPSLDADFDARARCARQQHFAFRWRS